MTKARGLATMTTEADTLVRIRQVGHKLKVDIHLTVSVRRAAIIAMIIALALGVGALVLLRVPGSLPDLLKLMTYLFGISTAIWDDYPHLVVGQQRNRGRA